MGPTTVTGIILLKKVPTLKTATELIPYHLNLEEW